MKQLHFRSLLYSAWNIYKKEWFFLSVCLAIFTTLSFALGAIESFLHFHVVNTTRYLLLAAVIIGVIDVMLRIGFIQALLKMIDDKKSAYNALWTGYKNTHKALNYFLYYCLVGFLIVIFEVVVYSLIKSTLTGDHEAVKAWPLIVCIITVHLYFFLRFLFVGIIIIAQDKNLVQSVKQSWKMTRGKEVKIFKICAGITSLNIVGLLSIGIGMIITIPLSFIIIFLAYKKLESTE